MLQRQVGRSLTCMSGRFCTQGTASLPSSEGSRPCPGISHGNADRNWCRRAGPVGPPGYHIARNLHHLQLWAGKLKKESVSSEEPNIYSVKYSLTQVALLTFVNGQCRVFWAEERESPDILKGPSCPRTGVMVELSTSFSTALNGCSKALTVCTVLQKEREKDREPETIK